MNDIINHNIWPDITCIRKLVVLYDESFPTFKKQTKMEIMQHRIIIELVCFQTLIFPLHHVNSEGNVTRGICK